MQKKTMFLVVMVVIAALTLSSFVAYAGGDKNTLRGSEGEQIGEPAPDPAQDPEQPREGDPNPGMDNTVPDIDD